MKESLLKFTNRGVYCERADVYIDPNRAVERAIITHTHADHLKRGHKNYLAHHISVPVIRFRAGAAPSIQGVEYGERIVMNGVTFSLHPAGHMPGSAQIKIECDGEVWVVSGDYKVEDDKLNKPFEPVKCDTFITESTFASPAYSWRPQDEIFGQISTWWMQNAEDGKVSILTGYSQGKAQRLIKNIDHSMGEVFGHEDIMTMNRLYAKGGLDLPKITEVNDSIMKKIRPGSLIIAPPSVISSPWLNAFEKFSVGFASGWMADGSSRMRRGINRGFAISDHADWGGLNWAIKETGAENIFVTHGNVESFVKWLRKSGYNAHDLKEMGNPNLTNTSKKQMELF